MCRFLWRVLCRNESTITGQTLYPRHGSLNNVGLYLQDGGKDIESMSISAGLYVPHKGLSNTKHSFTAEVSYDVQSPE
jgi:hypothetical protein